MTSEDLADLLRATATKFEITAYLENVTTDVARTIDSFEGANVGSWVVATR